MATFILLETYNPLTTQGEGKKYINVEQIVFVEPLTNFTHTNNRVKNVNTRILLSTGQLLDIRETLADILKLEKETKEKTTKA